MLLKSYRCYTKNYITSWTTNLKLDKLPMGFGHLAVDNKDRNEAPGIYVETEVCENCSPEEVIKAFKAAYPQYDVYEEDNYSQKLAKLKRTRRK